MTYIAALLVASCFVIALTLLGLAPIAAKVIETAGSAVKSMRDPALNDLAKEKAARNASRTLMGSFLSMTGRTAIAFVASLLPLAIFDATGLARWSAVTHVLATWQGILLATGVTVLVYLVRPRH